MTARTAATGVPAEDAPDAGFTMMEMLVAMALFAALGSVLIGFAMGSSRVADDVRESSNVVGEARLAVERMSRELRQAAELSGALVDGGKVVSLTVGVDFDGDGTVEDDPADPERLTYTWKPSTKELTLSGGGSTVQVLAGGVDAAGGIDRHVLRQRDRADPERAETGLIDHLTASGHRR